MAANPAAGVRSSIGISLELNYRLANTECRVVATTPARDPELWSRYLEGAQAAYRRFGVEDALEIEAIRDGKSTSVFLAAIDEFGEGKVVAGARAQGPYGSAVESHAVSEWEGHRGQEELRTMIEQRIPDGVVEVKGAWVSAEAAKRSELFHFLARSPIIALTLLNARFAVGTAGSEYHWREWASSGGVIAEEIPPAPYPSDRYQAKVMWWDRESYPDLANRSHAVCALREIADLLSNVRIIPDSSLARVAS